MSARERRKEVRKKTPTEKRFFFVVVVGSLPLYTLSKEMGGGN